MSFLGTQWLPLLPALETWARRRSGSGMHRGRRMRFSGLPWCRGTWTLAMCRRPWSCSRQCQ
uniref:Uncharacterized protein n=1 Tax=Arundo donax TaxID=35708 RepID=A0A0A8Y2D6_ARUDO